MSYIKFYCSCSPRCRKMFFWMWIFLFFLTVVESQEGNCEDDANCPGDENCCSRFGFCGMGEGFCTPFVREELDTVTPPVSNGRRRSGAGCVLNNVEFVGGDLPALLGGGGVMTPRNTADECFNRCDETPDCKWFTYDRREDLCYLKSKRGYIRNRTDDFISGSTFRNGCNRDPFCEPPYSYHRQQCLLFSSTFGRSDNNLFGTVSIADARRNFNHSVKICKELGGFMPYDFQGFSGDSQLGNRWHWLNYAQESGNCWACRPGKWWQGVKSFPCTDRLSYSCQRKRAYSLPIPPRPSIYNPERPAVVARVPQRRRLCGSACIRRRPRIGIRNSNTLGYVGNRPFRRRVGLVRQQYLVL